jgi:hypothetical protein
MNSATSFVITAERAAENTTRNAASHRSVPIRARRY